MSILRSVTLRWFGHSAFLLGDGPKVLIDPWLDNPKSPVRPSEVPNPDLILITHGHADHIGNAMEIARRSGAPVVAIHEVAIWLKSQGVKNVTGMNKGGTIQIAGVGVTMTHAVHSSDIDVGETPVPGGGAAGYVMDFGSSSVYHAGDTDLFGDMALIRELYRPDVAIIPIGGFYTMGPCQASHAVKLLGSERVIGMHYGTFPALSGTPDELKSFLPEEWRSRVIELVPGIEKTLTIIS